MFLARLIALWTLLRVSSEFPEACSPSFRRRIRKSSRWSFPGRTIIASFHPAIKSDDERSLDVAPQNDSLSIVAFSRHVLCNLTRDLTRYTVKLPETIASLVELVRVTRSPSAFPHRRMYYSAIMNDTSYVAFLAAIPLSAHGSGARCSRAICQGGQLTTKIRNLRVTTGDFRRALSRAAI